MLCHCFISTTRLTSGHNWAHCTKRTATRPGFKNCFQVTWFACSTKILLDSCRNIFWVCQNWARERKAFVAGWRVEPASLIMCTHIQLWKFFASIIGYGVPTPLMWKVLFQCSPYQVVTVKIFCLKQHFLWPATTAWRFTKIKQVALKNTQVVIWSNQGNEWMYGKVLKYTQLFYFYGP